MSATVTMEYAAEAVELQSLSKSNPTVHTTRSFPDPLNTRNVSEGSASSDTESSSELRASQASSLRTFLAIFTPSFVGFIASFTSGIITVGLPEIARSLSLDRSLYLWPSSVYGLTSGATLLIAGSIADIVGARSVELLGITLLGVFTLACGFSTAGEQLVVFRALQGVALGMHLPASVSLISGAVPSGRARNFGFACLGFSQPLGFAAGLVLSGIMIQRAGWRSGFYVSGGVTLAVALAAVWTLPKPKTKNTDSVRELWKRVVKEIDWVGGAISSGGLAILAYVLAILSANLSTIRSAETIVLLTISVVLLLSFPLWMRYRERSGKSALVPNKLWKSVPFTCTCLMVTLSYGALNSIELFSSLYFQEIQNASPLTTSLYLLPSLATGVLINLFVGTFVHRIPALYLVAGSACICAASPLIMALLNPAWNYWYLAFWAQVFSPFSVDVLFTVGLIIVSDSFPEKTQALAGAVFNTAAQFGMTIGMGCCQVVALGVVGGGQGNAHGGESFEDQEPMALLEGYRASFWTMFAYMAMCIAIAVVGLRKVGRVGLKRD